MDQERRDGAAEAAWAQAGVVGPPGGHGLDIAPAAPHRPARRLSRDAQATRPAPAVPAAPAPRGRRPPRACRPTGWPRCRPSWSPCWPGSRPPSRRPSGSGPGPADEAAPPAPGRRGPRAGRPGGRPARRGRRAGRRRRPGPEPGGRRARRRARGGEERGRPHHPAGRRADAGVRRPGDRRAPLRRARGRPVTAAWVAGTVRARALARRRLGAVGARELARSARPCRGEVHAGPDAVRRAGWASRALAALQHQVAATLLWNLRVLAGWLPRRRRRGAAGCSPAGSRSPTSTSTCARLRRHAPAEPVVHARRAADRLAAARRRPTSAPQLRRRAGRSPWGDPRRRDDPRGDRELGPAARLGRSGSWTACPRPRAWARARRAAAGRREVLLAGAAAARPVPRRAATALLGPGVLAAGRTLARTSATAGHAARRRPLGARGVDAPPDLWRAEAAWWHRVERTPRRCCASPAFGPAPASWGGRRPGRRRLAGAGRARARPRRGRDRPRWRCSMRGVSRSSRCAMQRVAVVVPATAACATLLVRVADAGTVELDPATGRDRGPGGHAADRATARCSGCRHRAEPAAAALAGRAGPRRAGAGRARRPARRRGRARGVAAQAVAVRRDVAALAGLGPAADAAGAGRPARARRGRAWSRWRAPPRASSRRRCCDRRRGCARSFAPLVETYATVPYPDVDPTCSAGLAYVVDVRDDVRRRRPRRAAAGRRALIAAVGPVRPARPAPAGLALPRRRRARQHASSGCLYGEFFGPTGVVPVLWLSPLDEPVTAAGRRRSASARCCWPARTPSAPSTAGARAAGRSPSTRRPASPAACCSWRSAASSLGALLRHSAGSCLVAGVVVAVGRAGARLHRAAAPRPVAAPPASLQAVVELFDLVVRLGSNLRLLRPARRLRPDPRRARPGRLAAPRRALWRRRLGWLAAAVLVFVVGNAVAFALEALVAGDPGAAAGVLRAVLPGLQRRGPAVPALARPAGPSPTPDDRRSRHDDLVPRRCPRWSRRPLGLTVLRRRRPTAALALLLAIDVLLLAALAVLVVVLAGRPAAADRPAAAAAAATPAARRLGGPARRGHRGGRLVDRRRRSRSPTPAPRRSPR